MTTQLRISADALREVAEAHGVCVRPVVHQVTDTVTGQVKLVPTACGATLASKCLPCAQKNRRLRMQQCREGWHLENEPEVTQKPKADSEDDETEAGEDEPSARRVRSTKRRQDSPDLPRVPVEQRTVGTSFTTPNGRTYRPSMFATFTLPSYGRVRHDGTPVDPSTYDYRRAALDALHFPKVIDRLIQNLRRTVGYQVQYFAAVEPQRRLAPHLHVAVRGAIPRATFLQVVRATYHQVWWPAHDEPIHDEASMPVWVDELGYADQDSGHVLPTWQQALDEIDQDDDARPTHVIRLGKQTNLQGIIATEGDADRRVGYLTKYLAKAIGEAYGDEEGASRRQRQHLGRLHREVQLLPCSPACQNWLRYGVQPKDAAEVEDPGVCRAKAHDQEHLGCGGRRVLVSRKWTGKTLTDHRADRAAVVRQTLAAAGMDSIEIDRLSAAAKREDGQPRFEWRIWNSHEATVPIYRQVMLTAITERMRWQAEYKAAKERAGPLNTLPRPPDSQPNSFGAVAVKGERSESRSDTKCP